MHLLVSNDYFQISEIIIIIQIIFCIKRVQAQTICNANTIHCLIKKLHSYKYLSNDSADVFVQNFNEMTIDLFKNQSRNNDRNTGRRYDESMKEFAVTLHYYSPRGYRFVWKALCLPSLSTIRNWAATVEAEPGLLDASHKITHGSC